MFGLSKGLLLGGALGIAAAGIGGYYVGYQNGKNSVQVKWDAQKIKQQEERARYEKELKEALDKLAKDNNFVIEKVRTEYLDRIKYITETKYENRDVIKEVFRDSPYLSRGWVYTHNQLVDGAPIDPNLASDTSRSTFTERDSLLVIGNNYATARQAIEKDKGWNSFYAGIYSNYKLPSSDGVRDDNKARDTATSGSSERTDPTLTTVRED